ALFDPPVEWDARWFELPEDVDPTDADAFTRVVDGEPVLTERVRHLDYVNGRALRPGLRDGRVALVAEGTVALPASPDAAYELRTISDDGVRGWGDGALVIDNWQGHGSTVDRAVLAGGTHRIRVEYYEAGGWAELRLDFAKQ